MDEKVTEFTAKLRKVQEAKPPDPEEILQTFVKLKKRFRPVFRHYFTEKHKTPLSWFQMRLRYTRSTAAASIVGHVLGLGDRHTSNILLDNVTGEVVHIDLGIAFDQVCVFFLSRRNYSHSTFRGNCCLSLNASLSV